MSGFITRFAGDDRYIVDYLIEGVMTQQPDAVRDSCCSQRFSTGSPDPADWVRARGVSSTDEARYLSEFDHLTLVRLLLARHRAHQQTSDLVQAAALLDRLHESAESVERAGSLLEIRLLQALVHDAPGHRTQALEALAQALELAP